MHCGLTKTGSTAFQLQLFENRDRLLAHHYYVPKTGIYFDDRMPGTTRTDGHQFIFSPNGTERDWSNLRDELSAIELPRYTLILSCENLTQASMENFQEIRDRFLGATVEFHFLVRNFRPWLSSQISEYAIGGNTRLVPNDRRLSNSTRYGVFQQIERLCALKSSGLEVYFHSYELLKGDDIAINLLRHTNAGVGGRELFGQHFNPAKQHNKIEHNSRFVLLAMRFNQATQNLSFTKYQIGHSELMALRKQPFYRLGSDQSCVVSSAFLEQLKQQISFNLQGEFGKEGPLDLLFPKGVVKMPASSCFDVEELEKINNDFERLLRSTGHVAHSPAIMDNCSLPSRKENNPTVLLRRAFRSMILMLRRTRLGTKFVLWLRQFSWLYRFYQRL